MSLSHILNWNQIKYEYLDGYNIYVKQTRFPRFNYVYCEDSGLTWEYKEILLYFGVTE